jgi:predicted aminopeptidase
MIRIVLSLACVTALSGCYYLQAANGQWELTRKREPIDELLGRADTSPELAARLRLVQEARQFAIDELGLPDNDTYRTYADLERQYVIWNVFAAPEFSLEPKTWCFPVAGCVGYRGYFKEDGAERQAAKLRAQGYDVWVGGVAAYSTLGKLKDPVLNTMMNWDDSRLVAVLFHELAHQVVYVKGDSAFNESFASAVEEFGIQAWWTARAQHDAHRRYLDSRQLRERLMRLVDVARSDLTTLYASGAADDDRRVGKRQRFDLLATQVAAELERNGRQPGQWLNGELNNARLVPMALYEGWLPAFRAMLRSCDNDIQCFYDAARNLAEVSKEERDAALSKMMANETPASAGA